MIKELNSRKHSWEHRDVMQKQIEGLNCVFGGIHLRCQIVSCLNSPIAQDIMLTLWRVTYTKASPTLVTVHRSIIFEYLSLLCRQMYIFFCSLYLLPMRK